jgi:pyruvate formate lyase activating enzyme
MGAVDGPGIRFVVFLQGCPLRCVYCHNPDTWDPDGGEEYDMEAVVAKILRFRPYFGDNGGVTVSGGEPLMQWEFVAVLFRRLKEEGIHTALDTSGIGIIDGARCVLKETDLVLCDLKFASEEEYSRYCGGSLRQVRAFLDLTDKLEVPVLIRHVVVPGLTDNLENIRRITEIAQSCRSLVQIDLLPFRKICMTKYEEMGISFPLADTEECSAALIEKLRP